MVPMDIATWVMAIAAVIGMMVTWRHYTKEGADKREEEIKFLQQLKGEQEAINKGQEDIVQKLDDAAKERKILVQSIAKMQTHCAEISSGLTERVKSAEKDIENIRKR